MFLDLHHQFRELSPSEHYLLGISGGRDSVALLHLLLANGYSQLTLCHLNHGLRNEESDADADFVRTLAEQYKLPYEIGSRDVKLQMQKKGESMELAARNSRHHFFHSCSQKYNCPRLLLAHHADDQAETILFNLLRGSGGLRGMSFQSQHRCQNKELTLYRPLLEITRNQIDRFLTEKNINYREDSSNAKAVATRNRLRNEAIPLLVNIMGREITPPLLRAEKTFQQTELALSEILANHQVLDPQGRLFIPELQSLHPALQQLAVHDYLKAHDIPELSTGLLHRCLTLLETTSPAKINLPGGGFLRRKEKRLFIQTKKDQNL